MSWTVGLTRRVAKEAGKLPIAVREELALLVEEIRHKGPVRGNWPNYSGLGQGKHHCHLKKGRPTYVACWQVVDKKIQLVEVYYAGTHEKASY